MTSLASAEGESENHRARATGAGCAHAKAILLGEHAVVYGAPALALPIPQLTVTASARWSPDAPDDRCDVVFTATGSAAKRMVTAPGSLRRLAAEFKAPLDAPGSPHFDVIVDCAIPPGRGLGSSAACARAVVLALAGLYGRDVSEDRVFELVQTSENVAHGRASGVDARTVGAAAPLLFRAGRTEELPIGCTGVFVIADSGEVGRTKDAVELLRQRFQQGATARETFVSRAAKLTGEAREALAHGRTEELGRCLTDYHELLRAAGLSTDRIDALVRAARTAGSLGAKITGGGLGGCAIVLAQPQQADQVARRLREAGAVRTWTVPLKESVDHAC